MAESSEEQQIPKTQDSDVSRPDSGLDILFHNIVVCVAYAVMGNVSMMLAIPPGYSTMVWPSAGIALAAVLLKGAGVWPGIVLGSFFVNVWVGSEGGWEAFSPDRIIMPLLMAFGPAIQAVVAAHLVRAKAGFPNFLASEREVLGFMVWGGAIASLISASIATTTMWAFDVITTQAIGVNFITWWAGDSVGVVVFAPLVLAWLSRPDNGWRARRVVITLPTLAVLATTYFGVYMVLSWERDRLKQEFNWMATPLAHNVQKTLDQYVGVMESMGALHASSQTLERKEFQTFSQGPLQRFSGFKALAWAPVLGDADRQKFIADVRNQGFANFDVRQINAIGDVVAADQRTTYTPIHYIEPGDETALHGLDLSSVYTYDLALERARDRGRVSVSGQASLFTGEADAFEVILVKPVFAPESKTDTLAQRRSRVQGYMVGFLDGEAILNYAFDGLDLNNLFWRVRDMSSTQQDRTLIEVAKHGEGAFSLVEQGVLGGNLELGRSYEIDFGGRSWQFDVAPTQNFFVVRRHDNTWLMVGGGMFATVLIGLFVLVVSGRKELLQMMVAEKTDDLTQSEQRLALAQQIAKLGNWTFSIGDENVWLSAEAADIMNLGNQEQTVLRKTVMSMIPPDERAELSAKLTHMLHTKQPFGMDHRLVFDDGQEKVVHYQCDVVLDENDRPKQIIGTVQDISERIRLDKMKNEFVSTVSHELRTPLTSIKGALAMVNSGALGDLPPPALEMIAIAHRNTDHLVNLVNDILDIGKFDSRNADFQHLEIDLADLIKDTMDNNRAYALEHDVSLVLGRCDTSLQVIGDRRRLMQVLSNLLSNAAKFSFPHTDVNVELIRDGDMARVQVTDRGEGIPIAFREHVFERFAQADSSAVRTTQGTGLGLSISKMIVEMHGGEIGFVSETGVGSSFYFTIPLLVDQAIVSPAE